MEPFATITPDRGDRPKFYNFCVHQLSRFEPAPTDYFPIDHEPTSREPDLTLRVRMGIAAAKAAGIDIVYIVESDDHYPKNYFEIIDIGDHDFIGCSKSLYYNLRNKTYAELTHEKRSSLYNTGFRISALEGFSWPPNNHVMLDLLLWKFAQKKNYKLVDHPVGVGIKHGVGMTGGKGHKMTFANQDDAEMSFLKSKVDNEAFAFYRSL